MTPAEFTYAIADEFTDNPSPTALRGIATYIESRDTDVRKAARAELLEEMLGPEDTREPTGIHAWAWAWAAMESGAKLVEAMPDDLKREVAERVFARAKKLFEAAKR